MTSSPTNYSVRISLIFALLFLLAAPSMGQNQNNTFEGIPELTDYAIYAGDNGTTPPLSPGYAVMILNQSQINGPIASKKIVQSMSEVKLQDVLAGGRIQFGNQNVGAGNYYSAYNGASDAFFIGDESEFQGNIFSAGDVTFSMNNNTFFGSVTLPVEGEYTGPEPTGGVTYGDPIIPSVSDFPIESTFAPYGIIDATSGSSLSPGAYQDLIMTGSQSITFTTPGTYTFKSVQCSGNTNTLKLYFLDDPNGEFIIHVHENVDLGKINVELVDGGSPRQIIWEVHGDGSSSANGTRSFRVENGINEPGQTSSFSGTVFATQAAIVIGDGFGASHHIGAFWSATQVVIGQRTTIDFDPFPFVPEVTTCTDPMVDAGNDMPLACGSTLTLNGTVNGADNPSWSAINGGNIVSQSGADATIDTPGTYVLYAENGNCNATDTVVISLGVADFIVDAGEDIILDCHEASADFAPLAPLDTSPFTFQLETLSGIEPLSFSTSTGNATFESGGEFALLMTDAQGCLATDTFSVILNEVSSFVDPSPDQFIQCELETLELTASTDVYNAQFTWTGSGPGSILSGGNTSSPTMQGSGIYTVMVTRDGFCNLTNDVIISLDEDYLSVYAGGDQSMDCQTDVLVLNDQDSAGAPPPYSIVSYQWTALNGGNILSGAETESPTVNAPGTYVMEATFETGCIGTDTVQVTFDPFGSEWFLADAGYDEYLDCNYPSVTLYGFDIDGPVHYQWESLSGAAFASDPTQYFVDVDSPGLYVLQVTSDNGLCFASDTVEVFEFESNLTANAGEDTSFDCTTGFVQLSGSEDSGAGVYLDYYWTTENGNIASGEFTDSPIVDAPGEYILYVSEAESSCFDTDTVIVTMVGPDLLVNAGSDQTGFGCTMSFDLEAISNNTNANFSWTAQNGGYVLDLFGNDPRAIAPGDYIVTANGGSSCTATDTLEVFPSPFDPSLSISSLGQIGCGDSTVTLSAATDFNGTIDGVNNYFNWYTMDGSITGPDNLSATTVNSAGSYLLSLNFADGECAVHTGIQIDVTEAPYVDAGEPNAISCVNEEVELSVTTNASNPQYNWTTGQFGNIVGGASSAQVLVNETGKYFVTVTDLATACVTTDSVAIFHAPCILPYYEPQEDGKSFNKIGSELTSLFDHYQANGTDTIGDIFRIVGDSVYIEVITNEGMTANVENLLTTSPALGMTDLIPNGLNPLIITGKFPIVNLLNLELPPIAPMINYVRPVFPAVTSAGVAYTEGDVAQGSDYARNGFGIDGSGVKVCVLSDSYNTVIGDPALADVLNGDLPGPGGPDYSSPVDVIQEYPYGAATDEGRAMLQLVHDISPGAELGFRTGVVSEGDLAMGVIELQQSGCDIIVDDVTFLTSPFFTDGVISQAVDSVVNQGSAYFVAAGNFENNSYEAPFSPVAAPSGFVGEAHDFGGGDVFQSLTLSPGVYTFVLQWEDEVYSLGDATTGTVNDFDIYLNNEYGSEYFGFNRDNTGGDPMEVMPFIVPGTVDVQANILITRAGGTTPARVKFIAFRGDPVFNEYEAGTSTIVGQANSESAITLGAVDFYQTPAYGVDPPQVSLFSSEGGSFVNGVQRNKPDIIAPNGSNTTVQLGAPDVDGDPFPNFFGTSAAAPHAAGGAALLKSARQQFYGMDMDPAEIKSLLMSSAQNLGNGGAWDFYAGAGLIQIDSAMLTLAAPTPQLDLLTPEVGASVGLSPFEVTVSGDFFMPTSVLFVDGNPVPTTFVSGTELTADIPMYAGDPAVVVFNAPITPSATDGGYSDTLYFGAAPQILVEVQANDTSKLFGQEVPDFESTITVGGTDIVDLGLSLADIGIASIDYNTPAVFNTNTAIYFIEPVVHLIDPSFEDTYDYNTSNGLLTVDKLPLLITPRDTTLLYGAKVDGREFKYDYDFDESVIPPAELAQFKEDLAMDHRETMAREVIIVEDSIEVNGRSVVEQDFINLAFSASQRVVVSAGSKVSQRVVVSGGTTTYALDTTLIVYLSPESIFAYQEDSADVDLVAAGPLLSRERAAVSQRVVVSGTAKISQRVVVSGSTDFNAASPSDEDDGSDIVVVFDEDDQSAPANDTIFNFFSTNLITGLHVDTHMVVSAALVSANFEVSNSVGDFIIAEAPLTAKPTDLTVLAGEAPIFDYELLGLKYDDSTQTLVTGTPVFQVFDNGTEVFGPVYGVGTYDIVLSGLSMISPSNYNLTFDLGSLTVTDAILTVEADIQGIDCGDSLPTFTATVSGIASTDMTTVITTNPSFSLMPQYNPNSTPCTPGEYEITPSGMVISPAGAYGIDYVSNTLYVNPKGSGAIPISIGAECVEYLPSPVNGYHYKVILWYKNYNSTTLYIPEGDRNNLNGHNSFYWEPQEIFLPGLHQFEAYFNGSPLTWSLSSWDINELITDHVTFDEFEFSCLPPEAQESANIGNKAFSMPFGVAPNPAQDYLIVSATDVEFQIEGAVVLDLTGKQQEMQQLRSSSESLILDFQSLPTGFYLLKVYGQGQEFIVKIMKE